MKPISSTVLDLTRCTVAELVKRDVETTVAEFLAKPQPTVVPPIIIAAYQTAKIFLLVLKIGQAILSFFLCNVNSE